LFQSGQIIGAPSITAQKFRSADELNAAADEWVRGLDGVKYIKKLIAEDVDPDQAAKEAKEWYIKNAAIGNYLAGGGQVPALPQDPPSLDLSSRF